MRHPILRAVALAVLAPSAVAQIYATDFTTDAGWTLSDPGGCNSDPAYAWAVDATPGSHFAGRFRSAPASLNFNDGFRAGPAFGGTSCGNAVSPAVDLSPVTGDATVSFWFSYEFNQSSGCALDPVRFQVSNDGFATLLLNECLPTFGQVQQGWNERQYDLDPAWGVVQFRFTFFGGPNVGFNDPSGPFIDDFSVDETCGAPTSYCVTSPNSASATGALIGALGSTSVADNSLRLYATDTSTDTFAIAFYGTDAQMASSGNGVVCVGGNVFRLGVVATGPAGAPSWNLDITDPPQPAGTITAGSTWRFQWWFRDGPGNWNYSDGLAITFCE